MFFGLRHYVALASDSLWLEILQDFPSNLSSISIFNNRSQLNSAQQIIGIRKSSCLPGFTPGICFFVTSGLG